jgi:tRNA1(Val) A37 N6-methylase TrmN6
VHPLRAKGALTLVHRADRLDEVILALRRAGCAEIAVLPLWPRAGEDARRVLVRARRGIAGPARLLPGLVLHQADGRFTAAAEAILRDGAALGWKSSTLTPDSPS